MLLMLVGAMLLDTPNGGWCSYRARHICGLAAARSAVASKLQLNDLTFALVCGECFLPYVRSPRASATSCGPSPSTVVESSVPNIRLGLRFNMVKVGAAALSRSDGCIAST
jgi:hypothetical protein